MTGLQRTPDWGSVHLNKIFPQHNICIRAMVDSQKGATTVAAKIEKFDTKSKF
jgi:hypothetical protein